MIAGEALDLLGGEVLGGAEAAGRGRAAGAGDQAGEAEVEDLDEGEWWALIELESLEGIERVAALAADQEAVAGLDVAVDDAAVVGGLQRGADLDGDGDDAAPREWAGAGLEQGVEALALEVLHHRVEQAVVALAEVGDGDAVLVAEAGAEQGLLMEAAAKVLVAAVVGVEDLDGDGGAEGHVAGLVDGAHAAAADASAQAVALAEHAAREVRCAHDRERQLGVDRGPG